MDSVLRTRCGVVSFLGAAGLLAAGVLLLTWFTRPVGAAQSAAVRETVRMPDGLEFPSWERPLQFSRTYYVDGNSPRADDAGPGTEESGRFAR